MPKSVPPGVDQVGEEDERMAEVVVSVLELVCLMGVVVVLVAVVLASSDRDVIVEEALSLLFM